MILNDSSPFLSALADVSGRSGVPVVGFIDWIVCAPPVYFSGSV
jgi:hypothetical protein